VLQVLDGGVGGEPSGLNGISSNKPGGGKSTYQKETIIPKRKQEIRRRNSFLGTFSFTGEAGCWGSQCCSCTSEIICVIRRPGIWQWKARFRKRGEEGKDHFLKHLFSKPYGKRGFAFQAWGERKT